MKAARVFILLVISVLVASQVGAQGGAIIVRVPDGTASRCIDGSKDRVWLTLRRLLVDKRSGWLTKDTAVGVLLRANLRVEGDQGSQVSFPLMTEATLEAYSAGQVSVPIEHMVVGGLRLQQDAVRYAGLGLEVTVLNRRGKTAWGKGLEMLAAVTSKLPIPASPAREAGMYLLDYANKVIDAEVQKQDPSDMARSATLALEFDPTGQCAGGTFESTGTIALLSELGTPGAALVPLGNVNRYCWSADLRPAFLLKAAERVAGDDCISIRPRNWFQVSNNYIGLVLNAVGASEVLGPKIADDMSGALERCEANGIDADSCFGEK